MKKISESILVFEEVILRAKIQIIWEDLIKDLFNTGIIGLIQNKELLKRLSKINEESKEVQDNINYLQRQLRKRDWDEGKVYKEIKVDKYNKMINGLKE